MWKDLSLKEKAAFMQVAVNNGIYDLQDIQQHYNKFAEGGLLNPYSAGSLVDAIYKNFKGEEYLGEPSHHYDFTISEEEANRLGYYPDERGHRDDRVKKPAHPTHPSRGKWNSFEEFELTDRGMENPNYTLFGLNDGGQDPQAIMTYRGGVVLPEITVTPKKKYIHNPYDNINIYAEGGPKDTYFGLTADDWKDVGLGMIPVVGTYRDLQTFKEDPTLVNGLGLGISAATDAATLLGIGALAKGSKALYKAYKAKEAVSLARQLAAKQAANTFKQTRLDRITDTATNKQVKSSIQSMLAKRQNAELARQKADFANTLFLDYTKRGITDTTKQIASPLKVDTGVNILQNWWNTNL